MKIESEGLNTKEILKQIESMNGENPSRVLLEGFVRKYYNL